MPNHWKPSASLDALTLRASLYRKIRAFFESRWVLEVETPLLSQHTVTDLHIQSFSSNFVNGTTSQTYHLQTSPEYAMKRLLAAGSGPIFQLCKAFRNGECGRQHNPEFTMLEWYRPGFTHHGLMQEVDEFLQHVLGSKPANKISYRALFEKQLAFNPLSVSTEDLHTLIQQKHIDVKDLSTLDKDTCLELILSECIEPTLGFDAPVFIYDYPASQAALAKIRTEDQVAERFELYIKGKELANGFYELTDAQEQQQRFEADNRARAQADLHQPHIDTRFIDALSHGLPDCSGVALGIDRLLMLMSHSDDIAEVISFPWDRA